MVKSKICIQNNKEIKINLYFILSYLTLKSGRDTGLYLYLEPMNKKL